MSVAYDISDTCTVGHQCIHTSFMYSCSSMNLRYLEIGIIPIESFKLKLWHFDANKRQFEILIFRSLNFIFDTGSLYSLEAMMLRVLLQLESLKSEYRNSRYVPNNRDYSMFKT